MCSENGNGILIVILFGIILVSVVLVVWVLVKLKVKLFVCNWVLMFWLMLIILLFIDRIDMVEIVVDILFNLRVIVIGIGDSRCVVFIWLNVNILCMDDYDGVVIRLRLMFLVWVKFILCVVIRGVVFISGI